MKTFVVWMIGMAMVGVLGCGGGGDAGDGDTGAAETTEGGSGTPSSEQVAEVAGEQQAESPGVIGSTYVVEHDPDAVYTMADVPEQGNYLKLDLAGLDADVLDKVLHRFKTEETVCSGDVGKMVEEILVTKPECTVTLRVAKNIIREEEMKKARGL